jgi:hypothetical protein
LEPEEQVSEFLGFQMSDITSVEEKFLWLASQFHRDIVSPHCNNKNAVVKALLSNLKKH